jgi:hypothetical protein
VHQCFVLLRREPESSPIMCEWVTLMPYVVEPGGTMLGMGVLGTIIVILVIVWLVRRV